jgi:translation initiation factor eIF-2B subunit alpha/methylthioribose-1-phosphate isomerase
MVDSVVFNGSELLLLDQRLLPHKTKIVKCKDEHETATAIKDMVVRGAPAIGITAAYGMALAENPEKAAQVLKAARPTAVDLANAVEYMLNEIRKGADAKKAAVEWHEKIRESTRKISEYGAALLKDGSTVLLHCNAGPLATGAYGTSLGAVLEAGKTKQLMVYVDETRPRFQGALTASELRAAGISHKVIVDSAAGLLLKQGSIDAVMVGADRIVRNGDFANKIGTYPLAVVAKENNVPFYVLAPFSTFDFSIENGDQIKIEQRSEDEVLKIGKQAIYQKGTSAYNPAFDVTPAKYVTAYVSEYGVARGISELQGQFRRG